MMFILEIRIFERHFSYQALNQNGFKDLEIYEKKLMNYLGVEKKSNQDEDEEKEGLVTSDGEFGVIEEVEGEEGSFIWEPSQKKSEEILI